MDGFINIDKPTGWSSFDVVARVRHLLRQSGAEKFKIGHCGTLDPAATGVLPLAVGRASRLSQFVMGQTKRYVGEITFGLETDSFDAQGNVVAEGDASAVTAAAVAALLPDFTGEIMQAPPAVSALKRGGEPLYKKVRRGETVQTEARAVRIYDLQLLAFTPDPRHPRCTLSVTCGQGAYIRSLAHDLGVRLGCGAHLSALRRTQVGGFWLENSWSLEQVESALAAGESDFLLPLDFGVAHLRAVTVSGRALHQAVHGNPTRLPQLPQLPAQMSAAAAATAYSAPWRVLEPEGSLLGIGRLQTSEQGCLLTMEKVLIDAERFPAPAEEKPLVACAIGNFDGLHLGHRALMEKLYSLKTAAGGAGGVVTFSPHPLTLIKGQAPVLLTSEQLKNELLVERFGVDRIVTLTFDQQLMNSTPEQFVDEVIVKRLGVQELVVGFNFTYAAQGRGTAELLKQQCAARGINVSIIPEVESRLGTVSSTRVRQYLASGQLDEVNELLGYWFCMQGEVVHGNHIGRTIGFPTANFLPAAGQAVMNNGVYAGRIEYAGQTYDGVINFGIKPTIGGETKPLVEAHVFDADLDLYGGSIRVYFGKFLRPERRFSGLDELKAQISADGQQARAFLAGCDSKKHLPKLIG